MTSSSEIFLADLLRAFAALAPADGATGTAIAELLDLREFLAARRPSAWLPTGLQGVRDVVTSILSINDLPASEQQASPTSNDQQVQQEIGRSPIETLTDLSSRRVRRSSSAAIDDATLPSVLKQIAPEATALKIPGDPLPPKISEEKRIPLPFDSLLPPASIRAFITAALSTNSSDGPIEIDHLVALLAQRHPILHLPRRPLPTLRRGVQLLVDRSEAMIPFMRDASWLEQHVIRVVGREHVQALRFSGRPHLVGTGPRHLWTIYNPPSRSGAVVLLLTDLGIGRPPFITDWATVDDWRTLAATISRAGCSVIALVPYSPARWPPELIRLMPIIPWDRKTTVGLVQHLIQPVRKKRP